MDTNTSSTSTPNLPAKKQLRSTRLASTSLPAPQPSSSPTLVCAPLRPSRSACRPPFRPLLRAPSLASARSLLRKGLEGECHITENHCRLSRPLLSPADLCSRLFKGLYPLWGRQIPYTMMKFASFETIVEMIYDRMEKPKNEYSKGVQTVVSFSGGYLAGILCAIVSHPADVMVSKLNANRKPGEAFGGAVSRIYGDIGFRGLWNGLPVRIVMIGTLTGLQWMIYGMVQRMPLGPDAGLSLTYLHRLLQDLYGTADHWWRCSASKGESLKNSRLERSLSRLLVWLTDDGLAIVEWVAMRFDVFTILQGVFACILKASSTRARPQQQRPLLSLHPRPQPPRVAPSACILSLQPALLSLSSALAGATSA